MGNILGSPRTTLAGLLAIVTGGVGSQLVPPLAQYLGGQPGILWQALGLLCGLVIPALMADAKKRLEGLAVPAPKPPKGFARLVTMLAIAVALTVGVFARPARAQESTSPLAVQLSKDLSLHVNVSVGAFAYDLTHKVFQGRVQFTGLYVLDYRHLVAIGLGASLQSNDLVGASVTGMLGSPSIALGPQSRARLGLLGQYQWLGADHAWRIGLAPTLEF